MSKTHNRVPLYTNIGGIQIPNTPTNSLISLSNFDKIEGNGYKVDWLTFTVSKEFKLKEIVDVLGYNLEDLKEVPARYFYNYGLTLGNYFNIYYNRLDDTERFVNHSNNLNYCFVFTGQGCTDLYNRQNGKIFDLFEKLISFKAKITRLDIAFDDFFKTLDFKVIIDKLDKGEFRSSKRSYNLISSSDVNHKDLGTTIYIGDYRLKSGSAGSHYLRIYDKKAQYVSKDLILPEIVNQTGSWQRYEISLKKQKANDFFITLMGSFDYKYDIDKLFKAVLRGLVEFLEPSSQKNKSRWKVCDWWEDFLNTDNKFEFITHERDADLGRILDWLTTSVMPSIKMLDEILDNYGFDIYELMKNFDFDKEDFSKKQNRLIRDSKDLNQAIIKHYIDYYLKRGDK